MNVSCLESWPQWRIQRVPMVTWHRQPQCNDSKVFTDSHKLPCIQFLFRMLLKKRSDDNALTTYFFSTPEHYYPNTRDICLHLSKKSWHNHIKLIYNYIHWPCFHKQILCYPEVWDYTCGFRMLESCSQSKIINAIYCTVIQIKVILFG